MRKKLFNILYLKNVLNYAFAFNWSNCATAGFPIYPLEKHLAVI